MENNHIVIGGKIVKGQTFSHECYGEKFYRAIIECKRSSGTFDYLILLLSEKLITTDLTDLYVSINGSIRTRNNDGHLEVVVFVDDLDIVDSDNNEVHITGYICKKNNIRKTPGGRTVLDLTLAVNRNYNKSDYVPVICWGRDALYADNLDIGAKVNVIGRLQSREYTKNDVVHVTYEVSAQDFLEQE